LGHIISKEQIDVDPKYIIVIEGWKVPKNFLEVRYFMGLDGYYIIFIEGF
jgi:hypothetical protein